MKVQSPTRVICRTWRITTKALRSSCQRLAGRLDARRNCCKR